MSAEPDAEAAFRQAAAAASIPPDVIDKILGEGLVLEGDWHGIEVKLRIGFNQEKSGANDADT